MQIKLVGSDEEEQAAKDVLDELRRAIGDFHFFLGREVLTDYRWRVIGRWLKKIPTELDWLWETAMQREDWYLDDNIMFRLTNVCYGLKESLEHVEHPPNVETLVRKIKDLEELVNAKLGY